MRAFADTLTPFMAALFVFAAILQYNDPDPLRWGLFYVAAAAVTVLNYFGKGARWMPLAMGSAAAAWSLAFTPEGFAVAFPALFERWEMADSAVEEGREFYGLLITAVWMGVLTARGPRRKAGDRPDIR
jgi:hypothetical protein